MHNRGMTAYESTVFLVMIAILIAGISSLAIGQFFTTKKFFSNAALEKSIRELYAKAELLPSGSQERAKIFIPKNTSSTTTQDDAGWTLRLTVDGREYAKTSKTKLVFMPANLLETPGTHQVMIQKESEKTAIIFEIK